MYSIKPKMAATREIQSSKCIIHCSFLKTRSTAIWNQLLLSNSRSTDWEISTCSWSRYPTTIFTCTLAQLRRSVIVVHPFVPPSSLLLLQADVILADLQRRFAVMNSLQIHATVLQVFESLSKTCNALQHCKHREKSFAMGCYTSTIFSATSYRCKSSLQIDQCKTTFKDAHTHTCMHAHTHARTHARTHTHTHTTHARAHTRSVALDWPMNAKYLRYSFSAWYSLATQA